MYSFVHMTTDAHKNDSAMHKDTDAQAISAEIVLTLFWALYQAHMQIPVMLLQSIYMYNIYFSLQAVGRVHTGHPRLQLPGGGHPLHPSQEEEGGGEGEWGGIQGFWGHWAEPQAGQKEVIWGLCQLCEMIKCAKFAKSTQLSRVSHIIELSLPKNKSSQIANDLAITCVSECIFQTLKVKV